MKKKIIALLLAALMIVSMAACASQNGTADNANSEPMAPVESAAQSVEEVIAASESDAEALAQNAPPASETDTSLDESAYNTAQEYVGRTVEELYQAIGEPTGGSQYAASCAQENAEDGMLFYDGFYVWSLRSEEQEVVYQVYLDD